MSTRKVDNPLALAVLASLGEAPNHPYDIAQQLRSRGKELSIKINYGSLYTVVRNLERHGFIKAVGTEREGLRPERTVYGITDAGHAELHDWMSELIGTPVKEYPRFEAALALAGVLHPDEMLALLEQRLGRLERGNAQTRAQLTEYRAFLPRIFLIEGEYALALAEAEERFVRGLVEDMRGGRLPELDAWRTAHETGEVPEEWAHLSEQALRDAERNRRPGRRTGGETAET